jgi:hypothetical protein
MGTRIICSVFIVAVSVLLRRRGLNPWNISRHITIDTSPVKTEQPMDIINNSTIICWYLSSMVACVCAVILLGIVCCEPLWSLVILAAIGVAATVEDCCSPPKSDRGEDDEVIECWGLFEDDDTMVFPGPVPIFPFRRAVDD